MGIERGKSVVMAVESGVGMLRDLLEMKEGNVRESEALRILSELVEECKGIHEKGIVLGELRIEDIWLGGEGKNTVKIVAGDRML